MPAGLIVLSRYLGKAAIFHCKCPWGGRLVKFVLRGFVVNDPPEISSNVADLNHS